jgi:hypothetical protein
MLARQGDSVSVTVGKSIDAVIGSNHPSPIGILGAALGVTDNRLRLLQHALPPTLQRQWAVFLLLNAHTLTPAFQKKSREHGGVWVDQYTQTRMTILDKHTRVACSIGPLILTLSTHHSSHELTFVALTALPLHHTLARALTGHKAAFIAVTVRPEENAPTLDLVTRKIALITIAIRPRQ